MQRSARHRNSNLYHGKRIYSFPELRVARDLSLRRRRFLLPDYPFDRIHLVFAAKSGMNEWRQVFSFL